MIQILGLNNNNLDKQFPEKQNWQQDVIGHPLRIQIISQQQLTISLRPQLTPYLEGKAAYVIIIKPCQLISDASVTCKSQKKISPLQRVTNRGLSRGRLKATRCWVRTRDPEPEEKHPLHLKHRPRAHYTNGEKVKSKASQMFVLHFVFGWKVVYSTSCPNDRGQWMWFAGKTVEVDDESVNVDILISRWKSWLKS